MGANVVLALDVGGTDTKMAIVGADVAAEPLEVWSAPTNAEQGPEVAFQSLLGNAKHLRDQGARHGTVVGCGLAVPGIIDEGAEFLVSAENLGWKNRHLGDELASHLQVPVKFGHDVRTGGLAEWQLGAGKNESDLVFIPVGTGIASALVLNNQLIDSQGYAGEVGHGGSTEGPLCPCGGLGCPERTASASAIARNYAEQTGKKCSGAIEVLQAVKSGDTVAKAIWDEAIAALSGIVVDIVRVTGVPLCIIGGGLAMAGDDLFAPLQTEIDRRLTVHRRPRLVPALLGKNAGMRGAGLLGWQAANVQVEN